MALVLKEADSFAVIDLKAFHNVVSGTVGGALGSDLVVGGCSSADV
jgi:hypothetical protein